MPRTPPKKPILLQFNCGFARCAVKEITAQLAAGKYGKAAREVNTCTRAETFSKLFGQASFGICTTTTSNRPSPFHAHCQAVLDAFKTGWSSQCKRQEYCIAFSLQRWRRLPNGEKARHSLQECTACPLQHADLQQAFPGFRLMCLLTSGHFTKMHQHRGRQKGQQQEKCYNM